MTQNACDPKRATPPRSVRVLLVEDDLFVRIDLADELRREGFEVIEAASADDALRFLETNKEPDLIFTDVQLPGRANGLQLADWVRSRFPDLPVVITSGDHDNQKAAERLGAFVPKPFNTRHIVELVTDIVGPPPSCYEKHNPGG